MDIEHVREQARKLEDRQEWWEALRSYLSVTEELQRRGESPDPALLSRIGELHIRTGDTDAAVSAWEDAIEAYLLEGLSDSALAVCRKIIRYSPGHEEMFLRMGQIRARQGLLIYARKHFLTYAEMVGQRGDVEEAIRAMEELVSWVPSDLETRLFLTERLIASDRRDKALVYLREGYWRALWEKNTEALDTLRPRILELDPGADLQPLPDEGEDPSGRPAPRDPAAKRPEPSESDRKAEGGVWARILQEELRRESSAREAAGPEEESSEAERGAATTSSKSSPLPEASDFSQLLSRFKEETAGDPDEQEARAQYERGLEELEGGAPARAIALFDRALGIQSDFLPAYEMLGRCHLERGEPQLAIHRMEPAMELPVPVEDDLLGIYYQMGQAWENLGNPDEARIWYERVFAIDINYEDIIERLRALR